MRGGRSPARQSIGRSPGSPRRSAARDDIGPMAWALQPNQETSSSSSPVAISGDRTPYVSPPGPPQRSQPAKSALCAGRFRARDEGAEGISLNLLSNLFVQVGKFHHPPPVGIIPLSERPVDERSLTQEPRREIRIGFQLCLRVQPDLGVTRLKRPYPTARRWPMTTEWIACALPDQGATSCDASQPVQTNAGVPASALEQRKP